MKKVIMAVAILLVIPIMIIFSQFYLNSAADRLSQMITDAENNAKNGNISLSSKQIAKFEIDWEQEKHIFSTFVNHAELDIANQSAAKLQPYLNDEEDRTSFYAECETLKMQINHIADTEKFCADNIL